MTAFWVNDTCLINPRGQSKFRSVVITIFTQVVRPFILTFQKKRKITVGRDSGLAKWIIADTCLIFTLFFLEQKFLSECGNVGVPWRSFPAVGSAMFFVNNTRTLSPGAPETFLPKIQGGPPRFGWMTTRSTTTQQCLWPKTFHSESEYQFQKDFFHNFILLHKIIKLFNIYFQIGKLKSSSILLFIFLDLRSSQTLFMISFQHIWKSWIKRQATMQILQMVFGQRLQRSVSARPDWLHIRLH